MKLTIKRLALASILTAVSVIFDVIANMMIPWDNFGVPLFAIPLVVGAHILGPIYGGLMGLVSDVAGFLMYGKGTFNIFFSLSAVMWGLIPGLFLKTKKPLSFTILILVATHLLATTTNTFALWYFVSEGAAFGMLLVRVIMIPFNVSLVGFSYELITRRLEDQMKEFRQDEY